MLLLADTDVTSVLSYFCLHGAVLVKLNGDLPLIVVVSLFCRMCPIFQISNVTGENMDLLKMFLNLLSSRTNFSNDEPAEFQIDDTYSVPVSNKRTHSVIHFFCF